MVVALKICCRKKSVNFFDVALDFTAVEFYGNH